VDLAIGFKDALAKHLLHLTQGTEVLIQEREFGFIVDESFPDELAEIFTEGSFADKDIQAILRLLVRYSIGIGVIFEI
jgi:hypothetical protein